MRFDHGPNPEAAEPGRQYDLKLLRKLLPYAKCHWGKLVVAMVLVVVITGLEIFIPRITQTIIDQYIIPVDRMISADFTKDGTASRLWVDISDPETAALVLQYPSLFLEKDGKTSILAEDARRLSVTDLKILRKTDLSGLSRITLVFLMVVVTIFVCSFFQNLIMEITGNHIMHDLRMTLYTHIQSMPLSYFTQMPVARLVTRVANDITNMHDLFTNFSSMVLKDLLLVVGIAGALFFLDLKLALLAFLVLPFAALAAWEFARKARTVFRELRVKVAEINTRFAETISGIRVIQTFRQERQNADAFARLNRDNYLTGIRQINIFAVFMPVIEMLGITATAIVVYVGGGHALSETLTIGVLAAFISYIRMFFRPFRDLAEKYNLLQNAMASAERIFQVLDQPLPTEPADLVHELSGPIETIAFDQVGLSYNPGEPVLKSVSLTIAAGQTIAVVGATGSGKTSLVNLMVRFYDPTEGTLFFNGINSRRISPAFLRSRISLVMQDPFLFTGSLKENILFGMPEMWEKDLTERQKALLDAACYGKWGRDFPDGLETPITEGGATLSSGQRQLISVARAFVRDPEIIILDEATSYVDSHTEMILQEAIANLMHGRTSVVVAHRLTTARHADRIVVMGGGAVLETGTHDILLAEKGYYARLYQLQG
ncbi:ABC transporter ATP-binding protein/permease [Desulfosarcina sp. OttesenSCG-928-A07]|nr:ABC transporter ATP-binding protein/permease [Desulfosarcina sp. OttesenSCG-928-G17]MDL2330286.1 ABC transporter ATP-binding protein/permease [Desulfosarcina sp. OttesenSCG-928-A07]